MTRRKWFLWYWRASELLLVSSRTATVSCPGFRHGIWGSDEVLHPSDEKLWEEAVHDSAGFTWISWWWLLMFLLLFFHLYLHLKHLIHVSFFTSTFILHLPSLSSLSSSCSLLLVFFLVAVALRNQKVSISNGNGQVTKVTDAVSMPMLAEFTVCFEVERSSQAQVVQVYTFYFWTSGF